MIDIYRTTNVASNGIHLYVAVSVAENSWSSPMSDISTLELKFKHIPAYLTRVNWTYLGQVPSLPINTSLYPELLI